jgi:hypothetical protein
MYANTFYKNAGYFIYLSFKLLKNMKTTFKDKRKPISLHSTDSVLTRKMTATFRISLSIDSEITLYPVFKVGNWYS